MNESDAKRLQSINSQLLSLYLRLNQSALSEQDQQMLWIEINRLEADKEQLPHTLLYNERIQQYVTILRSNARSLQLQRHTLSRFPDKSTAQLSPDEIRQKNIVINKLKSIEKKVELFRDKLADLGLKEFELDDIVLSGYREQNKRYLQSLLQSLELAVKDFVEHYHEQMGQLPQDFGNMVTSWEATDKRQSLSYEQLRVIELKAECLQHGISAEEITTLLESITVWDEKKKQQQLTQLDVKLQQEAEHHQDASLVNLVQQWMQVFDNDGRLTPNQVAIVRLIKEMQTYGVEQQRIDSLLRSYSPQNNGLLSSLKNRFRRN